MSWAGYVGFPPSGGETKHVRRADSCAITDVSNK